MSVPSLAHRIVFDTFDANNDGYLDAEELSAALQRLGGHTSLTQAAALIVLSAGSGALGLNEHEFSALLTQPAPPSESSIRQAFDALDVNGDGVLTASEVTDLMRWLGVNDPQTVQDWIQEMDANGDGVVTFDEFQRLVSQLG
ncbi:MAG: EF-hand domain-containing protein [Myxococcota bacterium]